MYISSRTAKDCDVTATELSALGPGKCIALPADLQKIDEVDRLVATLSSKEKAIHVLVNNAGAAWAESVDNFPVRLTYDCHMSGLYLLFEIFRTQHLQKYQH